MSSLIQPVGPLTIDWSHPITRGLSYARHFRDVSAPIFIDNGADGFFSISPNVFSASVAGVGLKSGVLGQNTGAGTYLIPQTEGTLVCYATAGFAATDVATDHLLFDTGSGSFNIQKSGTNWVAGWNSNPGQISVSAIGTYTPGDSFSLAVTWTSAIQAFYFKGAQLGTFASPHIATNVGNSFKFGGDSSGAASLWSTTNSDAIYYGIFWSRVLSADELSVLSADPWCIFKQINANPLAMPALSSPSTPQVSGADGMRNPRPRFLPEPRRVTARGVTHYWPMDWTTTETQYGPIGTMITRPLVGNIYGTEGGSAIGPPMKNAPVPYPGAAPSLYFNGANTCCILNADPIAAVTGSPVVGQVSIAFWLYLESFAGNDGDPRLFIFGSDNLVGAINASGQVLVRANGLDYNTAGSLSLNTWTHLAFAINAGTSGDIYINGVKSAQSVVGSDGGNGVPTLFCLNTGQRLTPGFMREVLLSVGSLWSDDEVARLYGSYFNQTEVMPAIFQSGTPVRHGLLLSGVG